jgi:hypothetical protein
MTTINRRALVAGAVALVPAPALSGPVIHPDAELLDIGEQIKKRLPDYYKARQISHALYKQTEYATALPARATSRRARNRNGLLTRADIPMRLTEQMRSIRPSVSLPSGQGKSHYGRQKERPSRPWPLLWSWIA